MGDIGSSMKDGTLLQYPSNIRTNFEAQYAGVMAALALSCSTAVLTNVNYDDILATLHKHVKGSESDGKLCSFISNFKQILLMTGLSSWPRS